MGAVANKGTQTYRGYCFGPCKKKHVTRTLSAVRFNFFFLNQSRWIIDPTAGRRCVISVWQTVGRDQAPITNSIFLLYSDTFFQFVC